MGKWYSGTLSLLEPGHRIFVNVPQTGYVGVGVVTESVQPVTDFAVEVDGVQKSILEEPVKATNLNRDVDDPELRADSASIPRMPPARIELAHAV